MSKEISRRGFLTAVGVATGLSLAGCAGERKAGDPNGGDITPSTGPSASPSPSAEVRPSVSPTPDVKKTLGFTPAEVTPNGFKLHDSDGKPVEVKAPKGIVLDSTLNTSSDVTAKALAPTVPAEARDFQKYLNGDVKLAGYTDGTNDYNEYEGHRSNPQLPAYSWEVFTGEKVSIPGIGAVEGSEGTAAMVLILNRTDRVYRWPEESPVTVIAGFKGFGRIWNGEADAVAETESRLVNHYRDALGYGNKEKGFIGQCDGGADNCSGVNVLTAERVQWGNNPDGTPRYQFRLIRAENISAK